MNRIFVLVGLGVNPSPKGCRNVRKKGRGKGRNGGMLQMNIGILECCHKAQPLDHLVPRGLVGFHFWCKTQWIWSIFCPRIPWSPHGRPSSQRASQRAELPESLRKPPRCLREQKKQCLGSRARVIISFFGLSIVWNQSVRFKARNKINKPNNTQQKQRLNHKSNNMHKTKGNTVFLGLVNLRGPEC